MKIKKFVSLKDETIITEENVQILGERIAVYAVQSAKQFAYGSLNNLYKGLIRDINYNLQLSQHFTDGYDIAQSVIAIYIPDYDITKEEEKAKHKEEKQK